MAALRSFKRIPGPLQLLLLLLLLPRDLVVTGQNMEVTQLPETVSVKAGDSLTLQCTLTGANLPGGVRWYKGLDRNQPPIYSDKQGASNRGVRLVAGSNTNFSIDIPNIRPEDAGTYYCVKFRAGIPEREVALGKGTQVFVIAMPSQPVVRGPTTRVAAGSWAVFNCSTEGFSPPEITVSWLKDGKEIQAAQTNILNSDGTESISYQVESTVEIPLEQGDVKSQLTCQIQHRSLDGPLQQSFPLGDVLRVPPKLCLETSPPSPVQLNTTVTVTCSVEEFYPDDANLELFINDAPSRKGTVGLRTSNPDGTFSLKTYLEVMATEDRNNSQFSCVVQQKSQSLLTLTTKLAVVMQPEDHKCMGSAPSIVTGQNMEVTQFPETVSVKAGDSLTLKCTLTGANLPGGVRWYKGLDRNQPPIYSDKQGASNRGVRLVAGSNTDFSINIPNIRPEDAGTYYCVKFRAGVPERELALGKGTQVFIIGAQQQSLLVLWLPLFLNKALVLLLLSCLFLTKMCRCKKAKSRSRKPQEAKRSESPIRNTYS